MIVQFLGTGTSQGIPVIGSNHPVCLSVNPKDKRLRVSVLISWDQFNYVIDCGPDFRAQMLAANPSSLEGVIFTHEHADHTAGLDDIRPFRAMAKEGKQVLDDTLYLFSPPDAFLTQTQQPSGTRFGANAIFNGEILAIQTQSEGKKSVLIRHGNYISIYNNLESVYVNDGQKIKTGQPLGKIFTDRITGKTKLIFVLSKNTTRLNPTSWILKVN